MADREAWIELDEARCELMNAAMRVFGCSWSACIEGVLIRRDLPPFADLSIEELREVLQIVETLHELTATNSGKA